jgi:hypothetical protein
MSYPKSWVRQASANSFGPIAPGVEHPPPGLATAPSIETGRYPKAESKLRGTSSGVAVPALSELTIVTAAGDSLRAGWNMT